MTERPRMIPAAQYLRMSTSSQEYSLANQSAAIADYAAAHNFTIVSTYKDVSRTGVVLRNRTGLQTLLKHVIAKPPYEAILVYDVSRWGRFQDVDEAAHYEFLCRSAGVPVYYCAEDFTDQTDLTTSVLKGLKRSMAAEYSRELGDKVYRGQLRLASMGYKMGGPAPYGLRRVLVGADGQPKQVLQYGEYKSLTTDRIHYCLGPKQEVDTVRLIFRLALKEGLPAPKIVNFLNAKGLKYKNGVPWRSDRVRRVLRDSKYKGCYVWGQRTCRLHSPVKHLAAEDWAVVHSRALPPIVSPREFEAVQGFINNPFWTDDQVLTSLKEIWKQNGTVTEATLSGIHAGPSYKNCVLRFGSLENALKLIGYHPRKKPEVAGSRRITFMRNKHRQFLRSIQRMFPERISIVRGGVSSARPLLLLDGRYKIGVLLCARWLRPHRGVAWKLMTGQQDRALLTLCCLLAPNDKDIGDMYFRRGVPTAPYGQQILRDSGAWKESAVQLPSVEDFCRIASTLLRPRR